MNWSRKYVPGGRKSRNVHVIGLASICWAMWKLRNRACFEKKLIRSPAEMICYACSSLKYWAGMQNEETKVAIESGAEVLKEEALRLHAVSNREGQAQDDGTGVEAGRMITYEEEAAMQMRYGKPPSVNLFCKSFCSVWVKRIRSSESS